MLSLTGTESPPKGPHQPATLENNVFFFFWRGMKTNKQKKTPTCAVSLTLPSYKVTSTHLQNYNMPWRLQRGVLYFPPFLSLEAPNLRPNKGQSSHSKPVVRQTPPMQCAPGQVKYRWRRKLLRGELTVPEELTCKPLLSLWQARQESNFQRENLTLGPVRRACLRFIYLCFHA